MTDSARILDSLFRVLVVVAFAVTVGCAGRGKDHPYSTNMQLEGSQVAPPVATSAKGKGDITVLPDRTVTGRVIFSGLAATAANIHMGDAGKNGPAIIALTKTSDTTFTVPAGTKLNNAQYAAFRTGGLYVNVRSARHPGGEIRAQIKPAQ